MKTQMYGEANTDISQIQYAPAQNPQEFYQPHAQPSQEWKDSQNRQAPPTSPHVQVAPPQPGMHQQVHNGPGFPPAQPTRGEGAPPRPPTGHQAPPPGPTPGHPAHHQMPPPVQPVPQAPSMPEHMLAFEKMKKLGVPEAAILNKMRQGGFNPDDYYTYIVGGAPPAAPAPTRPAPVARTAAPRLPMNAQINRQKTSRKGGLMDAIRAGRSLNKATDRVLKPAVKKVNARDALLSGIRGGAKLKKVEHTPVAEPEEEENAIFKLLNLRRGVLQEDDSDSEDSGEWSGSD